MRNKTWLIIGGVVLILALGGGAFFGGMMFERSRAATIQSAFFAQRGGLPGGNGGFGGRFFQPGDANTPPGQDGFARGAAGSIKSIAGDTLRLSTAEDMTTVKLTDQTTVVEIIPASRDDLQAGQRVTVIGQRDENGAITAAVIQIQAEQP